MCPDPYLNHTPFSPQYKPLPLRQCTLLLLLSLPLSLSLPLPLPLPPIPVLLLLPANSTFGAARVDFQGTHLNDLFHDLYHNQQPPRHHHQHQHQLRRLTMFQVLLRFPIPMRQHRLLNQPLLILIIILVISPVPFPFLFQLHVFANSRPRPTTLLCPRQQCPSLTLHRCCSSEEQMP